jgi:transposase
MIPPSVRIFVCTEPVDMRKSFDGLALAARDKLGQDPKSGALFVYTNKRANRLKALWFDRNGYCLLYKRLHDAVFVLPSPSQGHSVCVRIDGHKLAQLLAGAPKPRKRRPKLRIVH